MTHKSYLPCLKAPIDFPPPPPSPLFASLHIKTTSALMFSRGLTQNNNTCVLATGSYTSCSSPLFLSTLPSLSLPLCHSYQYSL
ncbi:unnamed protein product [Hymenolepis diminuta]|uniref:Uncharacterized protein n=1 Tax=Hymenolepis diminuta TaxID=6216 RepID=A0A564XW67_HYMDI|nr:unnamed protein product [Hymenolepis diminuta]